MAFAVVQGSSRRVRLNVTNTLGYFLIKFTNQYNLDVVYGVFVNLGSTLKPIIEVVDSGGYGVPNTLDGEVNLNVLGNWNGAIYKQSSATNLNIDLAEYIETVNVYVQGNSSCVVQPRNSPAVKTCQDVSNCLGISSEGSASKYLNEQGDFLPVTSSGYFEQPIECNGSEGYTFTNQAGRIGIIGTLVDNSGQQQFILPLVTTNTITLDLSTLPHETGDNYTFTYL